MGANATAQWWVRTDGNDANGGGYDSGIGGAGTNYCDQAAAELTLTDLATAGIGNVTLTSTTGGFTAQMIGSAIRIISGTNVEPGYYWIVGYSSPAIVTLDSAPDDGVGGVDGDGVGSVGGAMLTLTGTLTDGGTAGTPAVIATPLVAGNTINIRGSGNDDGEVWMVDYDLVAGDMEFPDGSLAAGRVKFIGYNGRPHIQSNGRLVGACSMHLWEHVKMSPDGTNLSSYLISSTQQISIVDCIFDQNGQSHKGVFVTNVVGCLFKNSGSTADGIWDAITTDQYGGDISGNVIADWRGGGVHNNTMATVHHNIICDLHTAAAAAIEMNHGSTYHTAVHHNIIDGCDADGILLTTDDAIANSIVYSNVITNCGGYGIGTGAGTAALNDRLKSFIDHNCFYNNTSGEVENLSNGANDVTLTGNPYPRSGDYALNNTAGAGAAVRGAGYPDVFPDGVNVNYADGGALQHEAGVVISQGLHSIESGITA